MWFSTFLILSGLEFSFSWKVKYFIYLNINFEKKILLLPIVWDTRFCNLLSFFYYIGLLKLHYEKEKYWNYANVCHKGTTAAAAVIAVKGFPSRPGLNTSQWIYSEFWSTFMWDGSETTALHTKVSDCKQLKINK